MSDIAVVSLRRDECEAVMAALRAGVVPRSGAHLIQVGRRREIESVVADLARVARGEGMFRIVSGEYGAGKSFFLNLVETIAQAQKFVTVHADLAPGRRLHGAGGQARALYAELMANVSTQGRSGGRALRSVVERFFTSAQQESAERGLEEAVVLEWRYAAIEEMSGGFDVAQVLRAYGRGIADDNQILVSAALRWLRGEYTTRTEAKSALGVRQIVGDDNYYDILAVLALVVRQSGYSGLIVAIDEMVNIAKIPQSRIREQNYERLLLMLNDSLQKNTAGLGFLFGATTETMEHSRRGVVSYAALSTRLSANEFASGGRVDFAGPVLPLASLSAEDLWVLCANVRHVAAYGISESYLVPDEAITSFLAHVAGKVGAAYFLTPRQSIREFADLLAVLEQNPETSWDALVARVEFSIEDDDEGIVDAEIVDNEFTDFHL
jgi:hypothetical protein